MLALWFSCFAFAADTGAFRSRASAELPGVAHLLCDSVQKDVLWRFFLTRVHRVLKDLKLRE